MMDKIGRKIFQPTPLTNMLIDGVCRSNTDTVSEFVNTAIIDYYTPKNEKLRAETEFLFTRIKKQIETSEVELQACLARCVDTLKDYPIRDARPLVQIFIHFTNTLPRVMRYDYIQIVDMQQDKILHRLNDILKTVDDDYTLGKREFGERSRTIFDHWEELCSYSEVYKAMSVLIECEKVYSSLDVFRCIDLIKWLDNAILASDLSPTREFEVKLSPTQIYYGIRYEIAVYQTDNGYAALSGDLDFHFSPEIKEYYSHYMKLSTLYGEATEEDIKEVQAVEQEGRMLFRRLRNKNKL